MKDYQREQWQRIFANAKLGLRSMYPQIEDAELLAIEESLSKMRSFIDYIAKERYDKGVGHYQRKARQLLKELEEE